MCITLSSHIAQASQYYFSVVQRFMSVFLCNGHERKCLNIYYILIEEEPIANPNMDTFILTLHISKCIFAVS